MLATMNDRMAMAYRECAIWSDAESYEVPDDAPWSGEAMTQASIECAEFVREAERSGLDLGAWDAVELGHCLWLSRNGHGAGFFDRDLPHADALQELARGFGERAMYLGDDGQVYFFGG